MRNPSSMYLHLINLDRSKYSTLENSYCASLITAMTNSCVYYTSKDLKKSAIISIIASAAATPYLASVDPMASAFALPLIAPVGLYLNARRKEKRVLSRYGLTHKEFNDLYARGIFDSFINRSENRAEESEPNC